MVERLFPVDIFAAKEYGIERWHDEFFWPVSDDEFNRLHGSILESFKRRIAAQRNKEIADILTAQSALHYEYRLFLHALSVIKSIEARGMRVTYSGRTPWYKEIAEGVLDRTKTKKAEYSYAPGDRKKAAAKNFVKYLLYNRNLFKIFNSIGRRQDTVTCGNVSASMKNYIRALPGCARITTWQEWLPPDLSYELPEALKAEIDEAGEALLEDLKAIAQEHAIELTAEQMRYLRAVTRDELTCGAALLRALDEKIARRYTMLMESFGSQFYRALAITVRKKGGRVISFAHGLNIAFYDCPYQAFSEYALSDKFITYTEGNAGLFGEIKKRHEPIVDNDVEIETGESREFLKLWERHRKAALPEKIRSVMIVGYPHNYWRQFYVSAAFSFMQLDLELRAVMLLKEAGYDVIYKPHPDRIEEARGIFDGLARVVYKGDFRDYLDTVDAFFFTHTRKTAFPLALCTNKPIIVLKLERELFDAFEEPFRILKKRCRIVSGRFDERNRILFDREEFLEAFRRPCEEPDTDFLERYMFPRNK